MVAATEQGGEPPGTWEEEILAYERQDRRRPAPRGGVLFVGSSSIRLWTSLESDMAPLAVVNRGFGGAQMDAVLHYAPRIVIPYRPSIVVLNCGENDLEAHNGKTPERVMADVKSFVELVSAAVPGVRFFLFSIKPSPARRANWAAAERFNRLLIDFCSEQQARCSYVDAAAASRDDEGKVREDLFLEDGLHLSASGYRLWTSLLRPRLLAQAGLEESSPALRVAAREHGQGGPSEQGKQGKRGGTG